MPALIALLFLSASTSSALAHGGERHEAIGWTFDPWIVAPLAIMGLLYGIGSLRLRRRGSGTLRLRSTLLYWSGLITLAVALVSPMHELGEHLFSIHMVEHELVVAVAAPLLVLARPQANLLWGMPDHLRWAFGGMMGSRMLRGFWQVLTRPAVATILHGLTLWLWHYPPLFDAAVEDVSLHRLQHLSFFGTAILFWWALIRRANLGSAAWHQFITMLHTSVLGALIALAPTVLYRAQTKYASDWGMSALEDQQLAGIIMWVPGGILYAAVALWFLTRWITNASKGGADGGFSHLA